MESCSVDLLHSTEDEAISLGVQACLEILTCYPP